MIDKPAEAEVARWVTSFEGWALIGSEPPEGVDVLLNGVFRCPASVGSQRADIPRNLGEADASERCGWKVDIDLASLPAGPLRVQAIAYDAHGDARLFAERVVTLSGDGFAFGLDEGMEGDRLAGEELVISGWAVIAWGYPARIEVEVNGQPPVTAQIRLLRENPRGTPPLRNRPMAGFGCRLRLSDSPTRGIDIEITVVGRDGVFARMPVARLRRVQIAASAESPGVESPAQPIPQTPTGGESSTRVGDMSRSEARWQLAIPAESTLVWLAGVSGSRDNHFAVVEAFAAVATVHERAVLAIAGDVPGPYADAVKALIEDLNLGSRVVLLSDPQDHRALLARADLVVCASEDDTLSPALREARALGVPVLTSDTPAMRAWIDDGSNGWLFVPRDVQALTARLYMALNVTTGLRRDRPAVRTSR